MYKQLSPYHFDFIRRFNLKYDEDDDFWYSMYHGKRILVCNSMFFLCSRPIEILFWILAIPESHAKTLVQLLDARNDSVQALRYRDECYDDVSWAHCEFLYFPDRRYKMDIRELYTLTQQEFENFCII